MRAPRIFQFILRRIPPFLSVSVATRTSFEIVFPLPIDACVWSTRKSNHNQHHNCRGIGTTFAHRWGKVPVFCDFSLEFGTNAIIIFWIQLLVIIATTMALHKNGEQRRKFKFAERMRWIRYTRKGAAIKIISKAFPVVWPFQFRLSSFFTFEYVHEYECWLSVARHACIIARMLLVRSQYGQFRVVEICEGENRCGNGFIIRWDEVNRTDRQWNERNRKIKHKHQCSSGDAPQKRINYPLHLMCIKIQMGSIFRANGIVAVRRSPKWKLLGNIRRRMDEITREKKKPQALTCFRRHINAPVAIVVDHTVVMIPKYKCWRLSVLCDATH